MDCIDRRERAPVMVGGLTLAVFHYPRESVGIYDSDSPGRTDERVRKNRDVDD